MDQDNPQSNPPSSSSQPNPTSQPNPSSQPNPTGETSSPSYPFLQRPSWEQPYGQQAQPPYGQPSTGTPATGATGAAQQAGSQGQPNPGQPGAVPTGGPRSTPQPPYPGSYAQAYGQGVPPSQPGQPGAREPMVSGGPLHNQPPYGQSSYPVSYGQPGQVGQPGQPGQPGHAASQPYPPGSQPQPGGQPGGPPGAQPPYGQPYGPAAYPQQQGYGAPPFAGAPGSQPGPQGAPGAQQGQRPAQYQGQAPTVAFDHALVTAAFELPAHTITRNYGMVRGIIVRSRSIFGQIGAGFQQLAGGNISIYTEMCERARQDAYEIMIQHAAALGANAVIGVRYDATEITQGVTEVLCYGTAVTVVPSRLAAQSQPTSSTTAPKL